MSPLEAISVFYYISDFAYEVKKCRGHPSMTFLLNKQNQIFNRLVTLAK